MDVTVILVIGVVFLIAVATGREGAGDDCD